MRNLIFWGLFPLALPQALYLKRTAPRLPLPGCEPLGRVGDGEPLRLIGIGDSVIAGVGVERLSDAFVGQTTHQLSVRLGSSISWSVYGRSGARVQDLLETYLPALPPEPADIFLVSVGVNDITGMTLLPVWIRRTERLIEKLRQHSPGAVIGLAGIPPLGGFPLLPEPLRFAAGQRGKAFDRAARRIARESPDVVHMPVEFRTTPESFCPDGFHPSASSYAQFGRLMADLLAAEVDLSRRSRARLA